MTTASVRFRTLGELAVVIDGRDVDPGPHKQRLVLALLLCRANTVVSTDLLTEAVWGERPPRTARKNLQVYVSALRTLLRADGCPDRIAHRPGGYLLRVEPHESDLLRFRELVREAERAARAGTASAARTVPLLEEALDLWHGPMLAELADSDVLRQEAEDWTLHRLSAVEDWAEAAVGLGRAAPVADRLAEQVRAHPLRERLRAVQMDALHRCGRRTEALACYDEYRRLLAAELGLDVGPVLASVHRAVLAGPPAAPVLLDPAGPPSAPVRTEPGPAAAPPAAVAAVRPTAAGPAAAGPASAPVRGSGPAVAPRARVVVSAVGRVGPRPAAATSAAGALVAGPPAIGRSMPSGRVLTAGPRLLLPPNPPDFTGRSAEAADLAEALAGRRSVLLTGPLGVGKTALAVLVAHRLADAFPDGCALLRMRRGDGTPRPVTALLAELCRVTGTPPPAVADEDEAVGAWHAELLDRRLLLVLDDATGSAAPQRLLPGPGGSAAVVTARGGLAAVGGLRRMELRPLPPGDGVRLLARLAGDDRVLGQRAAAERVVAAVGLLPLVIRLAGVKLAALRHLSLAAWANRLEQGLTGLDELTAAEPGVRDLLDHWWQELPPRARADLRALGGLARPLFTAAEAAAALGAPEPDACRSLEALIERGELDVPLGGAEVSAHAEVYELPLLVHLYVREQAVSSPAPPAASVPR